MLMRFLEAIALIVLILVLALVTDILLQKHTPDSNFIAGCLGVAAAVLVFIAAIYEKR